MSKKKRAAGQIRRWENETQLLTYYKNKFPSKEIFRWFNYEEELFQTREISWMDSGNHWRRFNFMKTADEFLQLVITKKPQRIDVGAIYGRIKRIGVKECRKALERELVIDIDINDYDTIRMCCTGAVLCPKCWKFISITCKIMDRLLRDQFNFKHIMWVYSGRRGVHGWICDKYIRPCNSTIRRSVVDTLSLVIRNKPGLSERPLTVIIQQALKIIDSKFDEIFFEDQQILDREDGIKKFINLLPVGIDHESIRQLFRKYQNGRERWNALANWVETVLKKEQDLQYCHLIADIKLQMFAPKLDQGVSTNITHLLKMPFTVHPKTGCLAIPFDIKEIDTFDLTTVPTITAISEYNTNGDQQLFATMEERFANSCSILSEFLDQMLKNQTPQTLNFYDLPNDVLDEALDDPESQVETQNQPKIEPETQYLMDVSSQKWKDVWAFSYVDDKPVEHRGFDDFLNICSEEEKATQNLACDHSPDASSNKIQEEDIGPLLRGSSVDEGMNDGTMSNFTTEFNDVFKEKCFDRVRRRLGLENQSTDWLHSTATVAAIKDCIREKKEQPQRSSLNSNQKKVPAKNYSTEKTEKRRWIRPIKSTCLTAFPGGCQHSSSRLKDTIKKKKQCLHTFKTPTETVQTKNSTVLSKQSQNQRPTNQRKPTSKMTTNLVQNQTAGKSLEESVISKCKIQCESHQSRHQSIPQGPIESSYEKQESVKLAVSAELQNKFSIKVKKQHQHQFAEVSPKIQHLAQVHAPNSARVDVTSTSTIPCQVKPKIVIPNLPSTSSSSVNAIKPRNSFGPIGFQSASTVHNSVQSFKPPAKSIDVRLPSANSSSVFNLRSPQQSFLDAHQQKNVVPYTPTFTPDLKKMLRTFKEAQKRKSSSSAQAQVSKRRRLNK